MATGDLVALRGRATPDAAWRGAGVRRPVGERYLDD
jgi:hypothetical protein